MAGEIWDAIVAGAGPAGATAAYFLSRAGQKVLVLEKQRLPRFKPCGGGLSLEFLGEVFPFSFEQVIAQPAQELRYRYLGVEVGIPCRPGRMALVMRDRFDARILEQAGCPLRAGEAVQRVEEGEDRVRVVTASGEEYTARYLVGADGVASPVAHSLHMMGKRWLLPAIEVEVEAAPDLLRRHCAPMFIFEGPRRGYAWIFPKGNHLSAGIGALGVGGEKLRASLEKIMARQGINLEGCRLHGHSLPLYNGKTRLATRRVLLAGDAAGLVDPLSGEGIRPAILSGKLAAECILAGQADEYPRLVRRKIGMSHNLSRGVGEFFFAFKELFLALGAPNPFTSEAILDMLSNHGSSLDVFIRSLLTLPYFIPMEMAAAVLGALRGAEVERRIRRVVFPY